MVSWLRAEPGWFLGRVKKEEPVVIHPVLKPGGPARRGRSRHRPTKRVSVKISNHDCWG